MPLFKTPPRPDGPIADGALDTLPDDDSPTSQMLAPPPVLLKRQNAVCRVRGVRRKLKLDDFVADGDDGDDGDDVDDDEDDEDADGAKVLKLMASMKPPKSKSKSKSRVKAKPKSSTTKLFKSRDDSAKAEVGFYYRCTHPSISRGTFFCSIIWRR